MSTRGVHSSRAIRMTAFLGKRKKKEEGIMRNEKKRKEKKRKRQEGGLTRVTE